MTLGGAMNDSTQAASNGTSGLEARERRWRSRLAVAGIAWLAFETLSGLALYLLPFSVPNQWMVLVHTAAGLLVLVPALGYQARHLADYWSWPGGAVKWMGYVAFASTLAAVGSGLVLTWQAAFGRRIGYGWDLAHVLSTFPLLGFAVAHVAAIVVRDRRAGGGERGRSLLAAQTGALLRWTAWTAAGVAVVAALWLAYPGERFLDAFPTDYSFKFGPDRPFAPSLARTETGGAYDPRSLSGSESCGTAGCHEQVVAEWRVSAHRWAAMDPGFQRIQEEMAKQNGPESTRYCGGCHDPISLFSGAKNVFNENLTGLAGYDEGVSCLVCHAVRKTDLEGNANYVLARPRRYLFELSDGAAARFARDFLIRAYPRAHLEDLSKRLFKTPEYCAACHKQFIDQEVNNVGWVQLQNQYDNWRKSRWNHPGDPTKTIECRECHMPLVDSRDPAAGDGLDYNRTSADRKHRSHRFIGANQVMPVLLKIPGADEQVAQTERWLRGEMEIPEIAHKWAAGPAVAIELQVPGRARPGEEVRIDAVVTSNKVGHDFPTGPLDIIQSWVELTVRDASGAVVYTSGDVNEQHFIRPGSFMFKAEPVDQYGNLIDRHNLWEMVGVRYRRALFPGFSDTASYTFRCPGGSGREAFPDRAGREYRVRLPDGDAGATYRVTARLLYRKIDQYLLNFMFGENKLTAPITEMARSEAVIRVGAAGVAATRGAREAPGPIARLAP
jgi:hypothetical protein